MQRKKLFLVLVVLVLASLACSLGGGDSSSEVSPPSGGDSAPVDVSPTEVSAPEEITPTEAPPAADSGKYDTEFPMPEKVDNFTDMGDGAINYQTALKLEDVVAFYRDEFEKAGYVERGITTVISDTTFSIVWDGHANGKAIVVQGVDLGGGALNVNVRFEDV